MKRLFYFLLASATFLIAYHVHAQDLIDPDTMKLLQAPSQDEYSNFVSGIRGAKGLSWFVLALVGCQGLFLIFRTMLGEILGVYRLLVLAILSLGATIGVNLLSGKTIIDSVVLDAGTLMAYQVLLHQAKRQWDKRDEDRIHISTIHSSKPCGLSDENFKA